MSFNFFQNTLDAIREWFESIYLAPVAKLVKVPVNKPETLQRPGYQQRRIRRSRY
jgi:hypothetical protein